MTSGLDSERSAAHRDLDDARQELLATLAALEADDFARSRRGGWSVGRVVQHVIQSEWHYAHLVRRLRELPPEALPDLSMLPGSRDQAVRELSASRQSLLDALADIDEDTFYRLTMVGREEYSVLSVLENVAHHDREHGQQVRSITTRG